MCEPRGLFLLWFKPWYNELFQTVDTLSCSERGLQLTFILNPVVHCRCYDRLSLLILFQLFLHKQFVLPHFLSEFCDIVLDSQKFMCRKKQIQFQFLFQQNRFIHQYLLHFQIIQCPAVFLWARRSNYCDIVPRISFFEKSLNLLIEVLFRIVILYQYYHIVLKRCGKITSA